MNDTLEVESESTLVRMYVTAGDEPVARLTEAADERGARSVESGEHVLEAAFSRALDALRYAVFAREQYPETRIALHRGPFLPPPHTADPERRRPARAILVALADAAEPGQLLMTDGFLEELGSSGTSAFHAKCRDLGRIPLRPGAPPRQIYGLVGESEETNAPSVGHTNLPAFPGRLMGRRDELASLQHRLGRHRVVTLTGAAGIGKTRLAVAYGRRWRRNDRRRDVWYVDLRRAETLDEVVGTVGAALGVPFNRRGAGDEDLVTLGHAVAARGSGLIILDGPGDAAGGVAVCLQTLLPMAPHANWILSARRPLNLIPEYEVELEGVSTATAVALFDRHRLATGGGPLLDERDIEAIDEIREALGGNPQSIALAARAATIGGPTRLAERLRGENTAPTSEPRELARVVENAIDELDGDARRLLGEIVNAPEPLPLEIAPRCASIPVDRAERAIRRLLRRGLLSSIRRPPSAVSYLEPASGVRSALAAGEQTIPDEFAPAVARSFDAHAGQLLRRLQGPEQAEVLDEVEIERDGLRGAIEWSSRVGGLDTSATVELLRNWYATRGPLFEGRAWFDELAGRSDAIGDAVTVEALLGLGIMERICGNLAAAEAALVEASSRLEDNRNAAPERRARICVEMQRVQREETVEAEHRDHLLGRAREAAEEAESGWLRALVSLEEGRRAIAESELATARDAFRAGRELAESVGQPELRGEFEHLGAELDRAEHRLEPALQHATAAAAHFRTVGCIRKLLRCLVRGAEMQRRLERTGPARKLLVDALATARRAGEMKTAAEILLRFGHLAATELEFEQAREAFLETLDVTEDVVWPDVRGPARAYLAAAEAALGREDAARRTLKRARTQLANVDEPAWEEVMRLIEGVCEVAAVRHGHAEPAALRPVQKRFADTAEEAHHPLVLDALRVLDAYLTHVEQGAGRTSDDSTHPTRPTLVVQADAEWFQPPGRDPIDLSRRGARRQLFVRLVRHRRQFPGQPLAIERLAETGWPDESLSEETARNRVYRAVSALRDLGLRDILQTHDNGYLFTPRLAIRTSSASSEQGV